MAMQEVDVSASACPRARLASSFAATSFASAIPGRRDLFPLPELPPPTEGRPAKRGMQQRAARRRWPTSEVNASVRALNDMHGRPERGLWGPGLSAQRLALQHVWDCFGAAMSEGECPTPREAFLALRGVGSSAYELPANLASYQKGMVALPQSQSIPLDLVRLLPDSDREVI